MMNVPYDQMDVDIRTLVYEMNQLPGIRTIGSCGGHEHPNHIQKPIGEWFVSFRAAVSRGGLKGLATIARLLGWFGVYDGGQYRSLINVEVHSDGMDGRSLWYSINGTPVEGEHADPEAVASKLAELRKQRNAR